MAIHVPKHRGRRLFISGWRYHSMQMPVAAMFLELRIPHAHSLKDRRQVVRSLKEKLAHGFNISIAEMDESVTWQSATLGIAAISGSRDYLSGLMEQLESAAVRIAESLGAEIAVSWDYLETGA
jgi:hypothetical protein